MSSRMFSTCVVCGRTFGTSMEAVDRAGPNRVAVCETCHNPDSFANMFVMFESRRNREREVTR